MRTNPLFRPLAAIALAAAPAVGLASPATLCTEEESTYLTAQLSAAGGSSATQQQEQPQVSAVSLCVSGTQRLPRLVLRIGRPGTTEKVIRSGPKQIFYTFTTKDSPHYGSNVIWVRTGSTEYCVSTALGQGRGVGLDIFVNGQWRHRLFSGTDTGTYEVTDSEALQEKVQALLRKDRNTSCV
jgi:hypothetical protein